MLMSLDGAEAQPNWASAGKHQFYGFIRVSLLAAELHAVGSRPTCHPPLVKAVCLGPGCAFDVAYTGSFPAITLDDNYSLHSSMNNGLRVVLASGSGIELHKKHLTF